MAEEKKIMTKHPFGKAGRNISREKYDSVKGAMLDVLKSGELTHTELMERMNKYLKGKFTDNISWYSETVKLDLEARKVIERTAARPQTYRLK